MENVQARICPEKGFGKKQLFNSDKFTRILNCNPICHTPHRYIVHLCTMPDMQIYIYI